MKFFYILLIVATLAVFGRCEDVKEGVKKDVKEVKENVKDDKNVKEVVKDDVKDAKKDTKEDVKKIIEEDVKDAEKNVKEGAKEGIKEDVKDVKEGSKDGFPNFLHFPKLPFMSHPPPLPPFIEAIRKHHQEMLNSTVPELIAFLKPPTKSDSKE